MPRSSQIRPLMRAIRLTLQQGHPRLDHHGVRLLSNSFLEGGQRLADGDYELLRPIALVGDDPQIDVENDAEQAGNAD